jgi:methanogenic corrinoid protein MtbC1
MSDLHTTTYRAIEDRRADLAEAIVSAQFERDPELENRYGRLGRKKSIEDAQYNLSYLAEAIAASDHDLFVDYVAWAKPMLASRGILTRDFAVHLEIMRDMLRARLPEPAGKLAYDYVSRGLTQFPKVPNEVPSFMTGDDPLVALAEEYLATLLKADRHSAGRMVLDAVDSGVSVRDIYLQVFQRTQHEIGRLWQTNQISVAQEHYCSAATQFIMSRLYPYIFSTEKRAGTVVASCVAGELHEIGARMVADFLEMDGWDTYYVGANTPTPSLVQTVVERRPQILAISVTITFNVRAVAELISAVRAEEACREVRILVGGYPFNIADDLWRRVGADGYAENAEDAVSRATSLLCQ